MPEFGKFLVSKPKNKQKSSLRSLIWAKNHSESSIFVKQKLVQQALKFGTDPFYKPPFSALWDNHPYSSWVLMGGKQYSGI